MDGRRQKLCRLVFAACIALTASACMEVKVSVRVQTDGSATMRLSSVVAQQLIEGKFVQLDRNDLLPLNRPQIDSWVAAIPGAHLVEAKIDDIDDPEYAKYGGLRRIRFEVLLSNLEAVRFDHIRFAFYPWRDRQVFQFIVDKNTEHMPTEPGKTLMDRNDLLRPMLAGRALTLIVELPNRVSRSNAQVVEWSSVEWRIPLMRLLELEQPHIVAWAESEADGSVDSWLQPIVYWIRGEKWRDPSELPAGLLDNSPAATPAP